MEPLIIFTLGYITGGVSALALIAFTLASRDEPHQHQRNTTREL